jgi:hypothetical protein
VSERERERERESVCLYQTDVEFDMTITTLVNV